jgi:RNase P/RNase MRP subunit p30
VGGCAKRFVAVHNTGHKQLTIADG